MQGLASQYIFVVLLNQLQQTMNKVNLTLTDGRKVRFDAQHLIAIFDNNTQSEFEDLLIEINKSITLKHQRLVIADPIKAQLYLDQMAALIASFEITQPSLSVSECQETAAVFS